MEKSITKGQNFDSFAEFDKVFKTYCDKTHQVYNKRSCRQLKIEDIRTGTIEEKELIKNKIVYKDIVYDCVHKGECRNNPNKKGGRVNILSKKIECEATIRVNFILKSQTFLITQIETNHNHPLNEDIYQQYSNVRKPLEKDLTKMVDMVNLGASVNKVVRQFNNDNDKALKVRDVWNQKRKLEKENKSNEIDRLEEILDSLSKNKNNTITTKRSDDGILENAFIMTEVQKKWLNLYPEIIHLDGTFGTNNSKYVLFTFLVQVIFF
jgi:hypothetical protein